MILRGKKVDIRPLTPEEADLVFEWSTKSDATPFWYGEIYGTSVPTKEEFFADFKPYYFDGSEPEMGRAFAVERQAQIIGHLHYDRIDRTDNSVELDIMIMYKQNWSHGYGPTPCKLCVHTCSRKKISKPATSRPTRKIPGR